MKTDFNHLIWIDLEMTGLDPEKDVIIEIASVVTDLQLNILAEGPQVAIHQSDALLATMDDWNTRTHGASGLTERVRKSLCDEGTAEKLTLDFLTTYVPCGVSPICGNSVGQDRQFLRRHMPTLESYFHYRNLDVSTLKILVQCWCPELLENFSKTNQHRALDDIRESIQELAYYRTHLFNI